MLLEYYRIISCTVHDQHVISFLSCRVYSLWALSFLSTENVLNLRLNNIFRPLNPISVLLQFWRLHERPCFLMLTWSPWPKTVNKNSSEGLAQILSFKYLRNYLEWNWIGVGHCRRKIGRYDRCCSHRRVGSWGNFIWVSYSVPGVEIPGESCLSWCVIHCGTPGNTRLTWKFNTGNYIWDPCIKDWPVSLRLLDFIEVLCSKSKWDWSIPKEF